MDLKKLKKELKEKRRKLSEEEKQDTRDELFRKEEKRSNVVFGLFLLSFVVWGFAYFGALVKIFRSFLHSSDVFLNFLLWILCWAGLWIIGIVILVFIFRQIILISERLIRRGWEKLGLEKNTKTSL